MTIVTKRNAVFKKLVINNTKDLVHLTMASIKLDGDQWTSLRDLASASHSEGNLDTFFPTFEAELCAEIRTSYKAEIEAMNKEMEEKGKKVKECHKLVDCSFISEELKKFYGSHKARRTVIVRALEAGMDIDGYAKSELEKAEKALRDDAPSQKSPIEIAAQHLQNLVNSLGKIEDAVERDNAVQDAINTLTNLAH